MKILIFWSVLIMLQVSSLAFANGKWSRSQTAAFHARFDLHQVNALEIRSQASSEIKLPTSLGYDQQMSGLCWVYATLNAIESNFLLNHANSKIAFSRAVMQYLNMEDRYIRKFTQVEDNAFEGGTAVDALAIMRNNMQYLHVTGLFSFSDFHPLPASASFKDPLGQVGSSGLYEKLAAVYGTPPTMTHDPDGNQLNPQDLAAMTLKYETWVAYSRADAHHPVGISQHFDPDARRGTLAKYIAPEKFIELIGAALKLGHALTISWSGHEEELFGADFDSSGAPTQIFVKGSYGPDYIHIMPISVIDEMTGLTTIALH